MACRRFEFGARIAGNWRRLCGVSTRCAIFLQSFSSIELAKLPVKSAQRKVAGFPGHFEDQTIGKPQRRTATVVLQRGGDRAGYANSCSPLRSTMLSNFSAGPLGFFAPISHF